MSRRSNKWLHLMLFFTVALAVVSCNRKTVYHHYEHTPLTGWDKADTLFFSVERMPQEAVIGRDVELRIADSYPFRSLCLIVEQTVYPSCQTRCDTVSCPLVDPDGTMLGQGITLYQYRFPLPEVKLNEGDSLRLSVRHNMRRETLAGIADIGIRMTAY